MMEPLFCRFGVIDGLCWCLLGGEGQLCWPGLGLSVAVAGFFYGLACGISERWKGASPI
jgi:hypothetical protein